MDKKIDTNDEIIADAKEIDRLKVRLDKNLQELFTTPTY